MKKSVTELYGVLEYEFKDESLLKRALTLGFGDHFNGYERLEFLGDRVLGLTVATMLFESFPNEPEGDLARRFAQLTRAETLAIVAEKLGFRNYLTCLHSGSKNDVTTSVLSDICEAVIAAIYRDGDFETAAAFVRKHWEKLMYELALPPVDAKTRLQEAAQARKLPLPVYTELERKGPDHNPVFVMQVEVQGFEPCFAEGASKREASQKAAAELLRKMKK
mgnify:CR=1 FL=1